VSAASDPQVPQVPPASGSGLAVVLAAGDGGRFEAALAPDRHAVVLRRVSPSGEEAWRRALDTGMENAVALAHAGGHLYGALYVTAASGSRVVALDDATGEILWDRRPTGLGSVLHSKYANQVTLRAAPDAVHVLGLESAGGYREALDPATGRTLSHEVTAP
jgi:outer membrane protein assembly factor BamB